MTTAELALRLDADPVRLERLVRFASVRGWVRLDRTGHVRPTAVTDFLRHDHPGGWRAWVEFAGGRDVVDAVAQLSVSDDAVDGFAAVNGAPFFEYMTAHPERGATFDQAMAAGGRMHALTLAAAIDWSATTSVCDVGGGTGELLATLLDLLPSLRGTLVELPSVIERAVAHDRLTLVGGDAFTSVPTGFDTYLLVNVLHDWSDDDAVRILRTVADACGAARVLVVDSDHPSVPHDRLDHGHGRVDGRPDERRTRARRRRVRCARSHGRPAVGGVRTYWPRPTGRTSSAADRGLGLATDERDELRLLVGVVGHGHTRTVLAGLAQHLIHRFHDRRRDGAPRRGRGFRRDRWRGPGPTCA